MLLHDNQTMASTYVYTALNIKFADLVQSHHQDEPTRNSGSSSWGKLQRATSDAYQRNLGLLLIIGSQIFLSLVNVAVKKLNDIDPPVSALEVRTDKIYGSKILSKIFDWCILYMKLIVVRMVRLSLLSCVTKPILVRRVSLGYVRLPTCVLHPIHYLLQ